MLMGRQVYVCFSSTLQVSQKSSEQQLRDKLRYGKSQSFLFKADKLREVLKRALKERIEGQKYDPVKGSQASTDSMLCYLSSFPECYLSEKPKRCTAASQAAGG